MWPSASPSGSAPCRFNRKLIFGYLWVSYRGVSGLRPFLVRCKSEVCRRHVRKSSRLLRFASRRTSLPAARVSSEVPLKVFVGLIALLRLVVLERLRVASRARNIHMSSSTSVNLSIPLILILQSKIQELVWFTLVISLTLILEAQIQDFVWFDFRSAVTPIPFEELSITYKVCGNYKNQLLDTLCGFTDLSDPRELEDELLHCHLFRQPNLSYTLAFVKYQCRSQATHVPTSAVGLAPTVKEISQDLQRCQQIKLRDESADLPVLQPKSCWKLKAAKKNAFLLM